MNTRSMVRIMMSAILLSAAVPALAAGPQQYGHDDSTYPPDDFDAPAAVAVGGGDSGKWTPEAAHDDTTYPAGPAYVIGTEAMASIAPELGHDDAPYPALDEAKPRSEMPAGRIAATTPSSASAANVPPAMDVDFARPGTEAGAGENAASGDRFSSITSHSGE
jgi:hypothetical protein